MPEAFVSLGQNYGPIKSDLNEKNNKKRVFESKIINLLQNKSPHSHKNNLSKKT